MRGTWKANFNQFDYGKYPVLIIVERVEGCKLWGTFKFITMNGETKFEGEVHSPSHVELHETKWIKGKDLVIDGTYKIDFIDGDCKAFKGRYWWPSAPTFTPANLRGKPGGAFTGIMTKGASSSTPSNDAKKLAEEALKDWKSRGVGESKTTWEARVANPSPKEKEFKEDAVNWVGIQRLYCDKINWNYAGDKGQIKMSARDFEEIYMTMSAEEAASLRDNSDKTDIRDIEYEIAGSKLKITKMEIHNPANGKTYFYPEPEQPEDETPDDENPENPDEVAYDKREIEVARELEVRSYDIKIEVYDKTTPDGDVVSIELNGEWLVKNLEVSKEHEIIEATLKPGENILILHAESEGRIPPNSAAVTIIDGTRKYKFTINSTLGKSGAVRLVRK